MPLVRPDFRWKAIETKRAASHVCAASPGSFDRPAETEFSSGDKIQDRYKMRPYCLFASGRHILLRDGVLDRIDLTREIQRSCNRPVEAPLCERYPYHEALALLGLRTSGDGDDGLSMPAHPSRCIERSQKRSGRLAGRDGDRPGAGSNAEGRGEGQRDHPVQIGLRKVGSDMGGTLQCGRILLSFQAVVRNS